jgi:hypothetical protein
MSGAFAWPDDKLQPAHHLTNSPENPSPEEVPMGRRLASLVSILSVMACASCTSVDGSANRSGYTRPDCATDYLYGQKATPCYTQR